MKLYLKHFTLPRPGAIYPDPSVPGLRYRHRKGGIFAELRVKTAHGWKPIALGRVPTGPAEVDAALAANVPGYNDPRDPETEGSLHVDVHDILGPVRARARQTLEQHRRGAITLHAPESFAGVADLFIERHVSTLAPRSQPEYTRPIEQIFKPEWGRKPLALLTGREITKLIDRVTDDRGPVAANRALAVLQSLLRWAVRRHHIDVSPAAGMGVPNREKPRDRALSDAELVALWPAFEELGYPYGTWAQTLLLTACRRTEAATMRWADIEGLDGPEPVWRIRQKGDKPHLVPLAPMAAALLRSLPRSGPFVFSSSAPTDEARPIKGYARAKVQLETLAPGLAPWRWHDLRRTCRTGLSRLRVPPHVCELVLGHAVTGLIKIYDVYQYQDEKRDALEAWERHLAGVLGGEGSVVQLSRGAA
jgi:integrase